ncbi:hypothetical protein VFPFJ_02037 [Purpureocillium lilacinum]|uniref:Uncharacterized protein n=1 Tax=Purpureocillium lilacinum TaxID=33203 RepID=A0A179HR33_PURLI|nr:hypothetical protein VFPFJ_02037 [Purpureocillium lilacinum]OAQ71803.1 hypothetical protein VFPBJ_10582 [Purpureocillium lilacinum]OAQ92876.1 hypothetical protein VFPFJ_02037 [Purpureocillium lilacinum]
MCRGRQSTSDWGIGGVLIQRLSISLCRDLCRRTKSIDEGPIMMLGEAFAKSTPCARFASSCADDSPCTCKSSRATPALTHFRLIEPPLRRKTRAFPASANRAGLGIATTKTSDCTLRGVALDEADECHSARALSLRSRPAQT